MNMRDQLYFCYKRMKEIIENSNYPTEAKFHIYMDVNEIPTINYDITEQILGDESK